jgi:hypothetical protein
LRPSEARQGLQIGQQCRLLKAPCGGALAPRAAILNQRKQRRLRALRFAPSFKLRPALLDQGVP